MLSYKLTGFVRYLTCLRGVGVVVLHGRSFDKLASTLCGVNSVVVHQLLLLGLLLLFILFCISLARQTCSGLSLSFLLLPRLLRC